MAIKIFTHPTSTDEAQRQNKVFQEQYQASLSHFVSEKVYLPKLNHQNIIKVFETENDVEITVPLFIQDKTVR